MKELEVARHAAAVGGEIIARYFGSELSIDSKTETDQDQPYNLVTVADVESERAIVESIRAAFPGDEILAEEESSADLSADRLWIVDPLDGTNNFAHGIPHFAVSIGFLERGQPQCGVIFNPVRDDWYVCQRGQGATCNDRPVRVAIHENLNQSLIAVGFYYDRGRMMEATLAAIGQLFRNRVHGIRRFGTASLDLCHVGLGWYGAYFEYELSPWDFAAGQLFVREAGGRVTDCQGGPLPIGKSSILASNGRIHEQVMAIVSKIDPQLNG